VSTPSGPVRTESQTLDFAPVESVGSVFGRRMGMLMKPGMELTAIHPAVEAGVNNQDIDGLMALYAEDASMILVRCHRVIRHPRGVVGASRDERAYNGAQSICNRSGGPCCAEQRMDV
jgi:hypothetical protein